MNAQEAIEQIEWLIEQHKQMQMYFADKRDDKQVRRYESLQNDIEALSIVLESAKLLHFLINEFEHDPGYRNFEIIDSDIYEHAANIYVDDEDTLTVRSDVAGKIGVEEGADE